MIYVKNEQEIAICPDNILPKNYQQISKEEYESLLAAKPIPENTQS